MPTPAGEPHACHYRPGDGERADRPANGPRTPSQRIRTAGPAASPNGKETLEETLELLATSELWSDADSLSETGVRHLKIDVQKQTTKRSRVR